MPTPTPTPTVPPACPTSSTDPAIPVLDFGSIASYSTTALAQGEDCTGFRSFLSTGLPQYDSQSFEFFGHLVDEQGATNSIALMSQGNTVVPGLQVPWLTMEESGLIFNRLSLDQGPTFGGIDGLADISVPTTISYQPWNIHVEQQNTGDPEQVVDMRVVSGAIGAVGSVYELTVSVETGMAGSNAREWTTLSIRAKDVTGIIQWGYGPNGFFPLWMFDGEPLPASGGPIPTTDQRTPIMNQYDGDIGAYLEATGDPMTGQGSHYYSMPLVEVEQWSVQVGSSYVASGTEGLLFFDNLTETYNDAAQYVVGNGYEWTEFSVQLPDSLEGMLIATTGQQEVGQLHYAMIGGAGSSQSANGTLQPTANWPQDAIHITPTANTWTSPHSCYVYHLDYDVQLDGSSTRPAADLVFSATAPDQELNALNRAVYEGLFSYTGTLGGEAVSGYAWGEIQGVPPTGNPVPPHC
ncbi:hypothetical protein M4I32_13935 [Microbacterium sp. LRZ72]|uniref:lipocalin family protein n=1 Tax=Microbacterium sp. LRZ72 TaxID=2942481 RepID=UPI0029BDB695|nr:lipocalin family protein [Microbacterium sp. LRZ72]MDX2377897.1 hypothetical protein [Microbacterium sp. LRZ72]